MFHLEMIKKDNPQKTDGKKNKRSELEASGFGRLPVLFSPNLQLLEPLSWPSENIWKTNSMFVDVQVGLPLCRALKKIPKFGGGGKTQRRFDAKMSQRLL